MSKRRITRQQSTRINKRQKSYQQATKHTETQDGLVLTRFGSQALIETESGDTIPCLIRQNMNSLVAGDKVVFLQEGVEQGVVVSRYPRVCELSRIDKRGEAKPVAANITQMFVVVAPKPAISWPLLDSYLIIAEHLNINACIILNKTDLDIGLIEARLKEQYAPLGYPVLMISQKKPNSFQSLLKQAQQQTSVFVGQSGVGKSSLISTLLPDKNDIQIAEISEQSELGKHTTSNSYYYHLPSGGAIIDSPGVREFALWQMPLADIARGYREFLPFIEQCKFRNCTHMDTPGCALQNAVKNGLIARERYNNYVKIAAKFL